MQLGVNHLGHFLLTHLLLDLLKRSSPSRVVVVSSKLYKYGTINFDDLNRCGWFMLCCVYCVFTWIPFISAGCSKTVCTKNPIVYYWTIVQVSLSLFRSVFFILVSNEHNPCVMSVVFLWMIFPLRDNNIFYFYYHYSESSCNKAFCYSQSKLANLLFTCELTRRLEDEGVTGVMVNTLSPGMVRTSPLTASLAFFKSPLEGAWMPLNLACSPDMEGLVGKCFANCVDLMPKVMDDQSVKRLWDVSESMVGSRHSSGDDPRYFSL